MVCCARAPSGHAAAAPPSSDMNARRLNGPLLRLSAGDYHTVAEERRCASQQKLRDDVADGVKMRRTRIEHILSALPQLATEERTFGIGSSVPIGDMTLVSITARLKSQPRYH